MYLRQTPVEIVQTFVPVQSDLIEGGLVEGGEAHLQGRAIAFVGGCSVVGRRHLRRTVDQPSNLEPGKFLSVCALLFLCAGRYHLDQVLSSAGAKVVVALIGKPIPEFLSRSLAGQ